MATTHPCGEPGLPSLRLTGGTYHADQTVPRQDGNSPFSTCVCHPGPRCLHTRRFGTLAGPPPPVEHMPWGPYHSSHALVHSVIARASSFTGHKISGLPMPAKYRHFRTICEQTFDNSPTDPTSSSLNCWSSMHSVATLYNC